MKDKICLICHTAIDLEKEYCEFKHYSKRDSIKSKAYYHVECFRNRMNGSEIQRALAIKTNQMIEKIGHFVD
ncbi:MAG: hypothetical protein WC758_08215 [Candidatus Woesearchaeota archaeon]|jgi:hypothetical protein